MIRYLLSAIVLLGCASADGTSRPSPEAQPEPFSCITAPGVEYTAWQDDYNTHVMRKVMATSETIVRTLPADVWEANFPSGPVSVDPETLSVCELTGISRY
jgi:hypothetical protein